MDPIVSAARAAVTGIKEGLAVGKELEDLVSEIAALGKADLAARQQYRRKQAVRKPDTHFFEAIEEWKRFREIYDMRQEMLTEINKRYGARAVADIVAIEERMKKDWEKIYNEDGHDRQRLFMLKVYSFVFATIVTLLMWINGLFKG